MAMRYDFKLNLIFYKVPKNTNRKMSLQVYINQFLKFVIKPWLLEKQDFVLEENGDNRYSKANNCNIIRQ